MLSLHTPYSIACKSFSLPLQKNGKYIQIWQV
nr:MAG TPA: hypothetical protein [Caudoviricetes sp.]